MKGHLRSRIPFLLGCLLLLLPGLPASAQSGKQDISIWSYENDGSGSAYDACYVLVGYSEVGCDENGDGAVRFALASAMPSTDELISTNAPSGAAISPGASVVFCTMSSVAAAIAHAICHCCSFRNAMPPPPSSSSAAGTSPS